MGGPLDSLSEQLTLAREYALLGSYDTALIFFEGVLAQINKYDGIHFLLFKSDFHAGVGVQCDG